VLQNKYNGVYHCTRFYFIASMKHLISKKVESHKTKKINLQYIGAIVQEK